MKTNMLSRIGSSLPVTVEVRRRGKATITTQQVRNAFMSGVSTGISVGALSMYMLDPVRGARRRNIVRDTLTGIVSTSAESFVDALYDIRNRGIGLMATTRAAVVPETSTDTILHARVRSRLGRAVSNPHSVHVTVENGEVTLSGPVRAGEIRRLLRQVGRVRGVKKVQHRLEIHESAENVPGLQGREVMKRLKGWSSGTRLMVGIAGGGVLAYGASRRDTVGWGLAATGFGLVVRSVSAGKAARNRRMMQITKTLNINAPVEDVFGYWSNLENFPLFMHYVRDVEDLGNGRTRWTVAGPAGITFHWDAEITSWRENEIIAWTSLPGAIVRNAGTVRFSPNPDGTTQLDIRLTYLPPAGIIGHSLATAVGRDPKQEIDRDLARMKTMIETGNPPRDAADPYLREARDNRPS